MSYANGTRYEGWWRAGKKQGSGPRVIRDRIDVPDTLVWFAIRQKYTADSSPDLNSPAGVMTYENGNRYDGEWENNLKHGEGWSS